MKKTRLFFWLVGVLILSGWIAFAAEYIHSTRQIAMLKVRIEQLDSQIKTLGGISKNLDQTIKEIDRMIAEFEKLKENLSHTREKIEKLSKAD